MLNGLWLPPHCVFWLTCARLKEQAVVMLSELSRHSGFSVRWALKTQLPSVGTLHVRGCNLLQLATTVKYTVWTRVTFSRLHSARLSTASPPKCLSCIPLQDRCQTQLFRHPAGANAKELHQTPVVARTTPPTISSSGDMSHLTGRLHSLTQYFLPSLQPVTPAPVLRFANPPHLRQ